MGRVPVWLDCDPGHDDAFAIILAAEHPDLKLLGVSTVHGNASQEKVTRNALSILTSIGRLDIPVYAGAKKPFMRPAVHASDIHGKSGIDGTDLLPEPPQGKTHQPGSAVQAMRDAIMQTEPNTCAVVATGTMTNIALLFATFPETAAHVKSVSIMGGSLVEGNISKYAEFNIFCDPEAATSVFTLPALSNKIYLIPLDLTHGVLATSSILQTLLTSSPTLFRQMLHDLLTFFAKTYADVFNITAGPPLHDPIAVAAILPEAHLAQMEFEWEEGSLEVVCSGPEIGRTILHKDDQQSVNIEIGGEGVKVVGVKAKVGKKVNSDAFWNTMMAAIDKSDKLSPLNG